MLLGALLSTGVILAQAPEQSPQSNAPQAAENQPARPHHEVNPDRQANHLGKKLGLTGDQVAKISVKKDSMARQERASLGAW